MQLRAALSDSDSDSISNISVIAEVAIRTTAASTAFNISSIAIATAPGSVLGVALWSKLFLTRSKVKGDAAVCSEAKGAPIFAARPARVLPGGSGRQNSL